MVLEFVLPLGEADAGKDIIYFLDQIHNALEGLLQYTNIASGQMIKLFALIYFAFKSINATAPLVLGLMPGIAKGVGVPWAGWNA